MVGDGAPILSLCLPEFADEVNPEDEENLIYVAPKFSKSGRPRGRPGSIGACQDPSSN